MFKLPGWVFSILRWIGRVHTHLEMLSGNDVATCMRPLHSPIAHFNDSLRERRESPFGPIFEGPTVPGRRAHTEPTGRFAASPFVRTHTRLRSATPFGDRSAVCARLVDRRLRPSVVCSHMNCMYLNELTCRRVRREKENTLKFGLLFRLVGSSDSHCLSSRTLSKVIKFSAEDAHPGHRTRSLRQGFPFQKRRVQSAGSFRCEHGLIEATAVYCRGCAWGNVLL